MLKGSKVTLRAMEPSDIEILFAWENDVDNWQISNTHAPFSRHILEQFVNSENDIFSNKQLRLMIVENETGLTVGTVDLFDFDPLHHKAGVGILIAENEFRRKGLAKESLRLLIEYAFDIINLHQLFCHIQIKNARSVKLFQGLGFEITGTKKDWSMNNGEWENQHFLQLIGG